MLNDIYNKRIIELAGNIPRLGRLPDPHASATAHSKLCGGAGAGAGEAAEAGILPANSMIRLL